MPLACQSRALPLYSRRSYDGERRKENESSVNRVGFELDFIAGSLSSFV